MPVRMYRTVRIYFILVMLTLSVHCTWEWAQRNDTEFCRDVLSCSRNSTNQTFVPEKETKHHGNDTKTVCELARQCTPTANTDDEWDPNNTDFVTEVEEGNNQRKTNRTEFCSILNSCENITSSEMHDYELQYLRNVSHYCPYSDYCGLGKSLTIPDNTSTSCCTTCSCSSDCGLHRECCFSSQDKYMVVETEHLTCVKLRVAGIRADFFIVDTCPNGTKCYDPETEPTPVSSALTKRIYINRKCADCHLKVSDPESAYIPWSMAVMETKSDIVIRCTTDTNICLTEYSLPQEHWSWIINFACGTSYTNFCPRSTQDQGLVDACKTTHAPVLVLVRGEGIIYGNTYCIMCQKAMSRYIPTTLCDNTMEHIFERAKSFNVLLDLDVIHAYKQADACDTKNGQIACRVVLCPEWMVKINGVCRHISKEWRNTYVSFQLTLQPYNNKQIKASIFQNMTKQERFNFHTWLSNECGLDLRMTNPDVYTNIKVYMLPITKEDITFIKEFLLRMEYKWPYLKPASLFEIIKRCIESKWKIALGDKTYYLSAKFYHYKTFMPGGEKGRAHISLNMTFPESPLPKVYEPITVSREFYYHGTAEKYVSKFQRGALILTKMSFCERVEISLDEVDLLYGQVYIRYSNTTLNDGEFTAQYNYDKRYPTLTNIYICKQKDVKNSGILQTVSFLPIVALLIGNML